MSSLFQQAPGDDATANALRAGSVTVAQRFTAQLNSLIQTLQRSNVRFVRCIKSNHQLQPQRMDKYVPTGGPPVESLLSILLTHCTIDWF